MTGRNFELNTATEKTGKKMEQFGRGYVCADGGEVHEVDFEFDENELKARCTCEECIGGRLCRHIGQFLSESPMSKVVGKYPLRIVRINNR